MATCIWIAITATTDTVADAMGSRVYLEAKVSHFLLRERSWGRVQTLKAMRNKGAKTGHEMELDPL